jgi:hypothetical protein
VGDHYELQEVVIGEAGQTSVKHWSKTVLLEHAYDNPVVFAQPASYAGGQTAVVRITDVQSDRFTLHVDEAPNHDGYHPWETVSYVVLEAGSWELADGTRLEVGKLDTMATVGRRVSNQWAQVTFDASFAAAPVVLSQVQTNNDPEWVKTRQHAVAASGFQVALEEAEVMTQPHSMEEVIGWLAIEAGAGEWNGHRYEAKQTPPEVTDDWFSIGFEQSLGQAPRFVASLASYNDADNAHLRYDNLEATAVQVKVEEDTTYDSETNHNGERVHYLAVEGDGLLAGWPSEPEPRSYYFFSGQRIVMRRDDVLYYLAGDHLGTTSVVLDANGDKVAESQHREASRSAAEWATRTGRNAGATGQSPPTTGGLGRGKTGYLACTTWGHVSTTARWDGGSPPIRWFLSHRIHSRSIGTAMSAGTLSNFGTLVDIKRVKQEMMLAGRGDGIKLMATSILRANGSIRATVLKKILAIPWRFEDYEKKRSATREPPSQEGKAAHRSGAFHRHPVSRWDCGAVHHCWSHRLV